MADQDLTARVTELESLFTHLQKLLQDLNDTTINQGKQIDGLEARVQQLTRRLESLDDKPQEPRDLDEERPPHY